MDLYLVKRNDEIGYDEYDSFVIAAENAAHALEFANFHAAPTRPVSITFIGEAVPGTIAHVVLGSFNAG